MRHIIITSALAALSLAVIATPASAETVSIDVPYADLNLSNSSGLAALERRIERAVNRICGEDRRPFYRMRAQQRCRTEVMAAVNEQVARIVRDYPTVALNR